MFVENLGAPWSSGPGARAPMATLLIRHWWCCHCYPQPTAWCCACRLLFPWHSVFSLSFHVPLHYSLSNLSAMGSVKVSQVAIMSKLLELYTKLMQNAITSPLFHPGNTLYAKATFHVMLSSAHRKYSVSGHQGS